MSKSESNSIQPKSIRQKRILDIAADNPGATLAEIAERIPSVSADHVDRVLDQYGDPATSGDSDTSQSPPASPDADANDGASGSSQDSHDDQAPTGGGDQNHKPTAEADEEPDSSSTTETPVTTSLMDPDTESDSTAEPEAEAEPTDSAVEPETEPIESTAEPEAKSTDSAAEPEVEPTEPTAEPVEAEQSDISTATAESDADDAAATEDPAPDPDDLTQKERETLRAISYEPTATQDQIADMLSISRATVSNRVNAIPGFEWGDRGSFVEAVFDEQLTVDAPRSPNDDSSAVTPNAGKERVTDGASSALSDQTGGDSLPQATPSPAPDGVVDGPLPSESGSETAGQAVTTGDAAAASGDGIEEISHRLDDLAQRLATMEAELQDSGDTGEASPLSDTDLLHKIVYACMNSDRITEEEELQILDTLMS